MRGIKLIVLVGLVVSITGCGKERVAGEVDTDGGDTPADTPVDSTPDIVDGPDAPDAAADPDSEPDLDRDSEPDAVEPECRPGDPPLPCGRETGPCERGLQVCRSDGTRSECVVAPSVRECADGRPCVEGEICEDGAYCGFRWCEADNDCGAGGTCVLESWLAREQVYDGCTDDADHACTVSICRYPQPGASCEVDADCGGDSCADGDCFCVNAACHRRVVRPNAHELCDGTDDNCDGTIDNDYLRADICGPCPFGTSSYFVTLPNGDSDFICVMDFEASRPDATAETAGIQDIYAAKWDGVIPTTGLTPADAERQCNGAELRERVATPTDAVAPMRICKLYEWRAACGAAAPAGSCNDAALGLGLLPTGSLSECPGDFLGNAAEVVVDSSGSYRVVGGSYLDDDPSLLACDGEGRLVEADEVLGPEVGFRCCAPWR